MKKLTLFTYTCGWMCLALFGLQAQNPAPSTIPPTQNVQPPTPPTTPQAQVIAPPNAAPSQNPNDQSNIPPSKPRNKFAIPPPMDKNTQVPGGTPSALPEMPVQEVVPNQFNRFSLDPSVQYDPSQEMRYRSQDKTDINKIIQNRKVQARKFRADVNRGYPDRRRWFNDHFWKRHRYEPSYWRHGQNLWQYGSWSTIHRWLSLHNSNPVYYERGQPVDLYPYQPYGDWQTQPSYYPSNYAGEMNRYEYNYGLPNEDNPQTIYDWIPLGVFALTNQENRGSNPVMFFQLSLNRNGEIAGIYYNQASDQIFTIEGKLNPDTQRVFWKVISGKDSPIFVTGLYNLTLAETAVDAYFGNELQQWLMIRM